MDDQGEILGIAADLEHKGWDSDRYVNSLTTLLERSIGGAATATARIELEAMNDAEVCLVRVPPSTSPVYAKTSKGPNVFYVRINNSTRILEGPELVAYVGERWNEA